MLGHGFRGMLILIFVLASRSQIDYHASKLKLRTGVFTVASLMVAAPLTVHLEHVLLINKSATERREHDKFTTQTRSPFRVHVSLLVFIDSFSVLIGSLSSFLNVAAK